MHEIYKKKYILIQNKIIVKYLYKKPMGNKDYKCYENDKKLKKWKVQSGKH